MPLVDAAPLGGEKRHPALLLIGVAAVAIAVFLTRDHGSTAAGQAAARGGEYCTVVARYKKTLDKVQPGKGADPTGQLTRMLGDIDAAAAKAPAEIQLDMQMFATAYRRTVNALNAAATGASPISPDDLQALNAPELEAGLARIASYDKRVCGVG